MFNIYFIIIISTLFISTLLEYISEYLNLSYLGNQLPDELSDIYDPKKYKLAQKYTYTKTRFSMLQSSIKLLGFLIFWFLGGYNWLDIQIRALGFSEIITGLLYIGVFFFASTIIFLPFSIFNTFVIEEKFGFNKTTLKTFIIDMIKGLILSIVLGGVVLGFILWFFGTAGQFGWLYAWGGVSTFMIIMQGIAPVFIMPIFNKFKPLEDGDLKTAILEFSKTAGFPLGGIFVVDGSRRSAKSNAYFTGFGKTRRIVLYDTLIENHTTDELIAILAHEIGHYKKGHIIKSMIISIIETGVVFYLLSLFMGSRALFDAFRMEQISTYGSLLFFGILWSPFSLILSIFFTARSRKNEFEADEFAALKTKKPLSLISALKKLSSHNLSNLTPHPFYVFLNYSHPPLKERIKALDSRVN